MEQIEGTEAQLDGQWEPAVVNSPGPEESVAIHSHSIEAGVVAPNRAAEGSRRAWGDVADWPDSDSNLELALVYEDTRTWEWARSATESLGRVAGGVTVRSHRWELGDLNQIHMLADAVATTSRADVILVALHAADELPLEFYAWVDAWLPRRPQTTGTLVGLVDVSGVAESTCRHTEEYLSAVARRGDLACVLCRCGSPIEPASAGRPLEAVVESSAVMGEIYEHWGLNE